MYERLILVGNLGNDPELRYSPQGNPVCNFSLAVSRRWTDSQDQVQEETSWFRVNVWGKAAESAAQYLAKGRKVLVEGTLLCDPKTGGPRIYARRDGTVGVSFEVRATTVRFLSPRPDRTEAEAHGVGDDAPIPVAAGAGETEEEMPF